LLFWLPLLKSILGLKCHLVSLTYARERLDFARRHRGIIALTPAAAREAHIQAPEAKVAMLGWGVDLPFFPSFPYNPEFFLSCGRTERDHLTLCEASQISGKPTLVISPPLPQTLSWPRNVILNINEGGENTLPFADLLSRYYANCSASLVLLNIDPNQKTAVGFTAAIEAMAMGRPVIATRTGAMPDAVEIETLGCGIFVPPMNPYALAEAMNYIHDNPRVAENMGAKGREHCERHYNIKRFSAELHAFFQSL